MGCQNCAGLSYPDCDGTPLLICVRQSADAFPQQAWAVATCVADVVTEINLFSDEAATIPLVGYTIADRVPCTQDFEQITSPLLNQLEVHQAAMESSLEEVETAIATASANEIAAINAASAAEIATAESVGEEIETAIATASAAEILAIQAVETAVENIEVNFSDPNYALAFTYTANGDVETITRTTTHPDFPPCEVQTFTYDADFMLTGISSWVACP